MKLIKDGTEVEAMRVSFQEEVAFYIVKCCQTFYDESLTSITYNKNSEAILKNGDHWISITYCPFCGKKIDIFNIQSL